ncbi:ABC transporter ATP-binding protein [Microbulbifer sp. CAU 1566]|uniref:ABC transporter ATP-binding protein n=1 Tax=Microbulbifer sp. CAU 1566 TaxID=2933269 RepID=UPI002003CD4F|nr:ABC transporter ATP-binding protein [Microbulbifer sp. CAU 1566]MCK7598337.1 ABC transporter ATP-binding protein [Microbulbifer sp. CAU 1566]
MSSLELKIVRQGISEPAVTSTFVIETKDLSLRYGNKLALKNLSLQIPPGRIHAIVGANGAGKSSLFRILLGFQSQTSGSAEILGRNCGALRECDRARIGFVNEEHSLPSWLRINEVVAMQRRLYPQWNEARYRNIVGHFSVDDAQRIRELSRGERAGVNLAIAMAQSPELLILDEPTLGLDVVAKRAFLEAVLSSVEDTGSSIIYCSHQMEEIERLADNLIVLERGELVHMSPPDEFCERVSLWVAEFPFLSSGAEYLPGVLQVQRIDGLFHFIVLDRDESFGQHLKDKGARSVWQGAVDLDRAVNAFLTRNHARPLPTETEKHSTKEIAL